MVCEELRGVNDIARRPECCEDSSDRIISMLRRRTKQGCGFNVANARMSRSAGKEQLRQ